MYYISIDIFRGRFIFRLRYPHYGDGSFYRNNQFSCLSFKFSSNQSNLVFQSSHQTVDEQSYYIAVYCSRSNYYAVFESKRFLHKFQYMYWILILIYFGLIKNQRSVISSRLQEAGWGVLPITQISTLQMS